MQTQPPGILQWKNAGGRLGLKPPVRHVLIGRPSGSAPLKLSISHVIREGPPFYRLGVARTSQNQLEGDPNQGLISVINLLIAQSNP
jgi:hypothetical protein